MNYEDTYDNTALQCADCGVEFEFTAEEQDFYREKGFSQPKRCPSCRSKNRARKNDRRGGGGGGGFRSQQSSVQRFDVTCSACGIKTTVPFKPNKDKPLYCPDCYKRQR